MNQLRKLYQQTKQYNPVLEDQGWGRRGYIYYDSDGREIGRQAQRQWAQSQEWYNPRGREQMRIKATYRFAQAWNRAMRNFMGFLTGEYEEGKKWKWGKALNTIRQIGGGILSTIHPIGAIIDKAIPQEIF